ncbi:NfeD family protein [Cognatiluteimonas telluris]|jgi:membrane protein implicated in regulation of membrane protease activity|uniref:NfeD family protein n=1 Tax=Cognatiluteimonas telluris TaxID=1104775 RepID=UPI00140CA548|nr:NfeD family protein [Lysobacter telluris]
MRWDVFAWAVAALLLFAAEVLAPGAFMLWLGLAAAVTFVIVLLLPMPLLAQVGLFVVLGLVSIQVYRTWFRGRGTRSDQPLLNRRVAQLVGRVVPLERAIVNGRGRVQIADALWDVEGPELPAGAAVRVVGADGTTLRVEPA